MNEKHHYDLFVTRNGDQRVIILRYRIGNLSHNAFSAPLPAGNLKLRISSEPEWYAFSYLPADAKEYIPAGKMETKYLSSEVAGGFTGVYLGMFATGNGKPSTAAAVFNWFDYEYDQKE